MVVPLLMISLSLMVPPALRKVSPKMARNLGFRGQHVRSVEEEQNIGWMRHWPKRNASETNGSVFLHNRGDDALKSEEVLHLRIRDAKKRELEQEV